MSSTFERVAVGDRWRSPEFVLGDDAESMTAWAGYVHPLFTDENYWRRAGLPGRPLPGELILLLLGGLAEQTGVFDDTTLALAGFEAVRFLKPVVVGDAIRLDMGVTRKNLSESGRRGFVTFAWECRNQRDELVLDALATLAFMTGGG